MPQKPPDVLRLIEALSAEQVQYVLIGGMAMVLHGSSYVTTDCDLAIAHSPDNVERIARALSRVHARPSRWSGPEEFAFDSKLLSLPFLELTSDAGSIDLLNRLPGIASFQELIDRSELRPINGHHVRVACLEDLIAMKRASTRGKDKLQLLELEALRELWQDE